MTKNLTNDNFSRNNCAIFASARVSPWFLSLGCIDSDRCRAIASTPLTLNRFHRRYENCRFRKTTSYATSSLFFSYFSYGEARVCERASERVFFFGKSRSRGLLSGYVCGKETLSFVANAQIRHDLCSVVRENFRDRATRLSLSKNRIDNEWCSLSIWHNFNINFFPGNIGFILSDNLIRKTIFDKNVSIFILFHNKSVRIIDFFQLFIIVGYRSSCYLRYYSPRESYFGKHFDLRRKFTENVNHLLRDDTFHKISRNISWQEACLRLHFCGEYLPGLEYSHASRFYFDEREHGSGHASVFLSPTTYKVEGYRMTSVREPLLYSITAFPARW